MQPPATFPHQTQANGQGIGYPSQSSVGYPSAGAPPTTNMHNGGGNVTYTQPGVLQTTKQVPPATSGTMPSQQPPIPTVNGYHHSQVNYQQQYQYQRTPPNNHTQHAASLAGMGTMPPPSMQTPLMNPSKQIPGPHNNYVSSPSVDGGYQPTSYPNGTSAGSHTTNQTFAPPHLSQQHPPSMRPPVHQMQNMQVGNSAPSYGPPGSVPQARGMAPTPGMPPSLGQGPRGVPPLGYPPQSPPGLAGPPGVQPSYPGHSSAPAKQRLDPEAMPSPIQVIEDDKLNRRTELFRTDGKGLVPPLVTTKFTVEDLGSASPRYIRCTTYNLPATADMAKTCQIPMCLLIKPLARPGDGEAPPFVVDPGPDGPIRCKRCKAYMCPQFGFTDGGRKFQCVFCNAITETPHNYFEHIDHMNQRVDKHRRAELCRGSYEYVTTKDYCRDDKFPNPPAFVFAIDVSYNAIQSGMVSLLCNQLLGLLDSLPREHGQEKSSIKIGFMTYSSVLHFYNLNNSLAQPQMMVVSDMDDVFVPLQDGFLVDPEQSRHVIESLLQQIPEMFKEARETELVFAPVIQAAVQAVQAAQCAAKLFMFHSSLPIGEAPGKLKNRDDRKLIGTDKEKALFAPAFNFYEKLAKECVAQALCVDLFLFPNQYTDVATLGQLPMLTGGQVFKYNSFRVEVDGDRFLKDLAHDVQRDIAFDAVMRVRTSTGVRPVEFIGSLHMSNTTDVELSAIDCDKAIHVELKHDDKIAEEEGAFAQVALLYTSVAGQRRLRIHNMNLSVCTQYADLYKSCETDVLMNYFAKKAVRNGLQSSSAKIREELISQASTILAMYRKHVASPSAPGQLILPECMKLVPVYLNCLLKNDAVHSFHDVPTDDRAYLRLLVLSMDVAESQRFLYPKLMPLMFSTVADDGLPVAVRCSEERLKDNEVYILDNGIRLFLWVGLSVEPSWIQNVFGVQTVAQIDADLGNLLVYDNEDSRNVREIISKLQTGKTRRMKLTIVRQSDKLEPWFKRFLIEDRGVGTAVSYVDFLCHMHKEIRGLLS